MDDIIVIILTLIFIVASIFGQKKKRPPIPETETETEPLPKEDNFWDMLDKQWDETPQPVSTQQQKPVEQQIIADIEPQRYTFRTEKEGEKTVARKPEKTKTAISKIKKKKFPLRDAVIYSEILNRKYT